MENNFTRGTNHDALRQAADANALQNGLPDSAFFSEQGVSTQIGHPLAVGIFTPSNPGSDLTPAQSDARNFINQIYDGSTTEINGETVHKVFDIDDPRFLTTQPTSGSGNESGGWTFGDREIFISEHRNNSGVHIAQSDWDKTQFSLIRQNFIDGEINKDQAFEQIENLRSFLYSGHANEDARLVPFLYTHRDSRFDDNLTNAEKSLLQESNLAKLSEGMDELGLDFSSVSSIDDVATVSEGSGFIRVGSKYVFSVGLASLIYGVTVEVADAKGSAAVDLASVGLLAYGLQQEGVLNEASIGELIQVIGDSNVVDLVADSLDNLAADAVLDVVLSGAASAIGIGLLWNGVQIIQSLSLLDQTLAYASEVDGENTIVDEFAGFAAQVKSVLGISDTSQLSAEMPEIGFEQVKSVLLSLPIDQQVLLLEQLQFDLPDDWAQSPTLDEFFDELQDNLEPGEDPSILLKMITLRARGDGTPELTRALEFAGVTECFAAGTLISMADGTSKSIETIEVNDTVTSYDRLGKLLSGRVTRTFQPRVKYLLDVHGLRVTPGHVTLCGDGKFVGQHVPIIDILRSDGALVRENGELVRACTDEVVGSERDRFIHAFTGERQPDGSVRVLESGQIRVGTKFITDESRLICVADVITELGGTVTPEGLIQSELGGEGVPFLWPFGAHLPKPEDYVLQRSCLTLNHIYAADEWEAVPPRLPVPPIGEAAPIEGSKVLMTKSPSAPVCRSVPTVSAKPMSRKQRRAAQARGRKSRAKAKALVH